MDNSYNITTDYQLIKYNIPPTTLPSPETNAVTLQKEPKIVNTSQIVSGGNDPTQTNSQLLSQITSNPSKQASNVPYTDGPLLKKLSVVGTISSAIQIKFNYFSSSFTTFTVVATPIASILSGPLPIVTQNIPISDSTGCTDITKNQHIYTITGLNQGTQYKLSLSATNYFNRKTTLVYSNIATNQPPDPPTNIQIVTYRDYSVDIIFTPPVQIISRYVANVYSGSHFVFSESFVVPKGTRVNLPLTVSGLNFHVYYTITMFAINSDGISLGSIPITFETPQIPDAPTNLFSPIQTSTSIDLSFNPPLQYVQYYTLVAFDTYNNQVFNQNINSIDTESGSQTNKYSITGLLPNRLYTIHVYSYNSDGISPTYTVLIAETLPTLVSVDFGQITNTSIQFTNLIGIYSKINVQRNIGSQFDGSFNISSVAATYNDIDLNPNTQYTYILSPINSFGFANSPLFLLPKYTYASGFIRGCTNISSFYMQINFIGYYSQAIIQRNNGTFIPGDISSNFPNSIYPQTNVTAFATDTNLSANTPYTYTVTIYNGDGVPNILSTIVGATTLCVVYNASFGTIMNNSIQIANITGVYSKLTILRFGGITGYVSFDIYNTTDTSFNDVGLFPNILYTYILIPYALNTNYSTTPPTRYYLPGVQYNNLSNGTYTRPTLKNAAFSNTTYNSISLYKITGIFDRVHIVRTTQGTSGPTATYDICSNVVSFTDISGLIPNSLNSYTLTSYNPNNLNGDIINLSIYTDASGYILPCIATGIDKLYLQWIGYDSSISIIRSGQRSEASQQLTLPEESSGGSFTPTNAYNYPVSTIPQSLTGGYVTDSSLISNNPYTYTVTLYNGNSKPTVISTTIGNTTLPQITAASFGAITTNSQIVKEISGNYTTVVINKINTTILANPVTTNSVATISGNSTTIGELSPNNNYTYSLVPFNGIGVSGSTFYMTSLYTLPSLISASFGVFTAKSLTLQNIVGSYFYVKIDRYTTGVVTPSYNIITVNSPDTSGIDLSLNPNTQYTYYLTPYNPDNTAGATYITLGKYTDISAIVLPSSNVTSSSLQLNWYGTYSNVAISRDKPGGKFPPIFSSTYPQQITTSYITDISVNTNTFYNYTFKFTNGDGLTNISDISQTILTLPTITSAQYSAQTYNSLNMQLYGLYYNYVKVYRVDVSNSTTISIPVHTITYPDSSYNDIGLSPNYQYQYIFVPYNINDISGIPVTTSPKYTDASGIMFPFTNITFFSAQINWKGYYTGISITRYINTVLSKITYGTNSSNTTQYSNIYDPLAQSLLTGYAEDISIIQNITYTYKIVLYNGDGFSVALPDIFLTNLPSITSTPTFGIITSTTISIINVVGICNNITVNRFDATGLNTKSYDVSNATTIYDTSVNFTNNTIPYDASYTYTLTPLGVTGASGSTVAVPGVIYSLPILYNVAYSVIDINSIQFNLFTGSYEYIQVDRYFGDSILQQRNAFQITKGQSSYTDVGLVTDVSYSYNFTPFNLSIPNISGGAIKLSAVYTKPYLPLAIYSTPTYTSIPIDVSSSICTSITINRYKAGPILDTSYDVSYSSMIYDTSFTNNTIPYDVSYTYTLMPKNHNGIYGTTFSGLGIIYTLPSLTSATFGTVTSNSIAINIITASCSSITINRIDASYGINTKSYDVSYAPIIYDTNTNFINNIIPSSVIYSYVLTPKNYVGLAGTPYTGLAPLYTLASITSATFGTVTSTYIPINVTGTGTSITINRIDPNTTNTKSYDVSFTTVIYDTSVNFVGSIIPYDVSYTYTLTPKNNIGVVGSIYSIPLPIYTIPAIKSAQYKTPTYQTIPIDISSSVGLCTNVTVTRYKGGFIDIYDSNNAIFDVSYASTIYDISTNFTNQIIPYNTAYTYKLSPKNPTGVYGADISLTTIYTLPIIISARYNTPTIQTIPIDVSSSSTSCSNIIVKRYKSNGLLDNSFSVPYTSTIYDLSVNFMGSVIPYDVSYTYTLTPLNVVGLSGTVYNSLGTIYTIPSITSASYGDISNNAIRIINVVGKYEFINVTRNLLNINNTIVSSVPNIITNISPGSIIIDNSGGSGLNPNTNYSYTLYAYNGSGQNAVYTMSGIYTLAQGSIGTITPSLTSATLTWSGIYSRVTINRSDNNVVFTEINSFPQNTTNGIAYDNNISSGTSFTYSIYLFNGSDVSTNIGSLSLTPVPYISNAIYTTITRTSIYLSGFTGSYSSIVLTRNKGSGYGVFDASYTINYPDTSHNDTGLLPNTSYSYSLLPFNNVGVSGDYYNITPRNIYTLPTITNVIYSASSDTINFTSIDGSYSYVSFTRYQNNTSQYSNIINGVTQYSDIELMSDASYSYRFVPWGSGSPAVSGDTFYVPTSGVIYTLPVITGATFGIPTTTQIPINVVSTCTNITINRFDPRGTNTKSYDVSNAAIIYDNSANFINNTIPYDISYVYTLTPKNKIGISGTIFTVGTIYTIPNISSATSTVVNSNSLLISVTGSYASAQVNRYIGSILQSSNSYSKLQFPLTDTNLLSDTSYNYTLIPYNESVPSVSGSAVNIPSVYTYGIITSGNSLTINSSNLGVINIQGTYDGIYYTRTGGGNTVNGTISTPVTSFYDPSMLIPDTSYTYVLAAINKDNAINNNSTDIISITNYTDASGYITSVTDTSSSITVYWSGYCNSGFLVYADNTKVPTQNIFSPVDGKLVNGYATDTSGGVGLSANTKYIYFIKFSNYNGRIIYTAPYITYTLAYYSSAGIVADSSSSITVNWTGYYSSITGLYQNGTLVTPDTSSNILPSNPQAINSGSITKTGLSSNTAYYYDVSLNNDGGVATGIARKSAYTLAYGSSSAPTPIDTSGIQINWSGIYSSALVTSTGGSISSTNSSNYTSSSTPQTSVTGKVYNTGLSSNTLYTYTITLYNGNTIATALTSQSVYTYPIVPTITSASSITDVGCTITFTEPTGTGTITYTLTGGTIGTKSTNTYTVSGLTSNSANSLKLAASNTSATATSPTYSVTTLPSAITDLAVTGNTSTGATLSWTNPSGTISSFTPSIGTLSSVANTTASTANTATLTYAGGTAGTDYSLTITCTNNTSTKTSSASNSVTFNMIAATTTTLSLTATNFETGSTLTNKDPSGNNSTTIISTIGYKSGVIKLSTTLNDIKGHTITFDIYGKSNTACDIIFGLTSYGGAGHVFRFETRANYASGFNQASNTSSIVATTNNYNYAGNVDNYTTAGKYKTGAPYYSGTWITISITISADGLTATWAQNPNDIQSVKYTVTTPGVINQYVTAHTWTGGITNVGVYLGINPAVDPVYIRNLSLT